MARYYVTLGNPLPEADFHRYMVRKVRGSTVRYGNNTINVHTVPDPNNGTALDFAHADQRDVFLTVIPTGVMDNYGTLITTGATMVVPYGRDIQREVDEVQRELGFR